MCWPAGQTVQLTAVKEVCIILTAFREKKMKWTILSRNVLVWTGVSCCSCGTGRTALSTIPPYCPLTEKNVAEQITDRPKEIAKQ